jgi:uncharacterized SAM-binding protein YcdF (DUF218 family)
MNPFFIFLFVCAIVALIYWFKNASNQQGIMALKGFMILLGLIFIVFVVIGRLPILAGIPILFAALFRKFALNSLLIPLIKLMAGSYFSKSKVSAPLMDNQTALNLLELEAAPTREQIVQAHRKKLRELRENKNFSSADVQTLDSARELLIQNCDD